MEAGECVMEAGECVEQLWREESVLYRTVMEAGDSVGQLWREETVLYAVSSQDTLSVMEPAQDSVCVWCRGLAYSSVGVCVVCRGLAY